MGQVLHASYSGYFPFCIGKDGNFGPDEGLNGGGVYPVGMNLSDAMEAFWQVSAWQLTIGATTVNAQPKFYKSNELVQTPVIISDEEELVCAKGLEIAFDTDSLSVSLVWSFAIDDPTPIVDTPYSVKFKDKLYSPRLHFVGAEFSDPENIAAGATIDFFYDSIDPTGPSGVLNFNGYNVQLYKTISGTPDADLNCSILPIAYRTFED